MRTNSTLRSDGRLENTGDCQIMSQEEQPTRLDEESRIKSTHKEILSTNRHRLLNLSRTHLADVLLASQRLVMVLGINNTNNMNFMNETNSGW